MTKRTMVVLVGSNMMLVLAVVGVLGIHNVASAASPGGADSVAVAVFEGRTPCARIAVEFTGFPSQGCEKIKWQLTFFRDARTQRPSAFLYEGTRTLRRGTWTIQRGTPFDTNAQVYRLTPIPPGKVLSLLSVDDKVLLLLDPDHRIVVGDASWSYALNRTNRKLSR